MKLEREHIDYLRAKISDLSGVPQPDPRGIVVLSILTEKPIKEVARVAHEAYEAYQSIFRGEL